MICFGKLLALLCLFALSGLHVQAQIGRVNGRVSGTVADSSGAPIPRVHVTTSGADGIAHSTDSTADGSFSLLDLPTGIYRLNATASGGSIPDTEQQRQRQCHYSRGWRQDFPVERRPAPLDIDIIGPLPP